MGSLVAIDPGACAGIAVFFGGLLVSAEVEDVRSLPLPRALAKGCVDVVIVERPEVYAKKVGKHQADPNDLIKLALRAGALVQAFNPREVVEVLPKTWKGQAPKEIVARRVLLLLDRAERDTMHACLASVKDNEAHNAIDAIGIGLFYLGRYRP